MLIKAIILFVLIIFFALLSFSSFISTLIGFVQKRKNLWMMSLMICLAAICLLSLTTIYTSNRVVKRIPEMIAPGPDVKFTQKTGLEWPESAKIVTTKDEFFVFDYEYYIIFTADHESLERWLSNSSPWYGHKWKPGPVPSEIPDGIDKVNVNLSTSENTRYVAREYCCKDHAFHSGDLLIIDLDSNMVWLKSWDY
jgi:hypothetical protein